LLSPKSDSHDKPKKTEIEIRDVLGTAVPFRQGGSLRLIIPKKVVKHPILGARAKPLKKLKSLSGPKWRSQ
jgi:hypothetical protein